MFYMYELDSLIGAEICFINKYIHVIIMHSTQLENKGNIKI